MHIPDAVGWTTTETSFWVRWLALAGGAPAAVLVRVFGGAAYRELLAPSIVLHALAVAWSTLAIGCADALQRLAPGADTAAGPVLGTLALLAASAWFGVTWTVARGPLPPLWQWLRPALLEQALSFIDRLWSGARERL